MFYRNLSYITLILLLAVIPLKSAEIPGEDEAVKQLGNTIHEKIKDMTGKKFAIDFFTSLDGKDTDEGKRISQKLLSTMASGSTLTFVERGELKKIIEEQELQMSGLISDDDRDKSGKILSVDVLITGTIAQIEKLGEITVKAVDIRSGKIYAVVTLKYNPQSKFSYKENPEALKVYSSDPDKIEKANRAFNILKTLRKRKPRLFLFAVADKKDMKILKNQKPRLFRELIEIRNKISDERKVKFRRLRNGIKLIKKYYPEKYETLQKMKVSVMVKF